MQRIDQETYGRLALKQLGRIKGLNPISTEARTLNIGEALVFYKNEWPFKSNPATLLSAIGKRDNRILVTRSLADSTGWVVTRMA